MLKEDIDLKRNTSLCCFTAVSNVFAVIRFPLPILVFHLAGGLIDLGHHGNWAFKALHETVALNKAVSKAVEMVDKGNNVNNTIVLCLVLIFLNSL